MMAFVHQTVLKDEAVAALAPGAGKVIVDGTLGGGGHSEALLRRGARVIGIDRDPAALAAARARLVAHGERFEARVGNFGDVERLLAGEAVDGLLLDLGVSSPQLDTAARGFSFQQDGPLDMRMGADGETAAELIRRLPESELADLVYRLGDEPFSRPIARELKRAQPATTAEAAEAVGRAVPRAKWPRRIHVATRTFQALRMAVNGELEALAAALSALPRVLKPGGRAAIISFHSLEDRLVKERFRELEGRCTCPPGLPVCGCGQRGSFRPLSRKAVTAGEPELESNPRARSAHLRAVEKVP
ncbi:MAG: 16S rRNA (cytosine(1402)-N(4))-methyltransferase RsmH [Deltaproteobacteria bacterium]|nr:16S rRNA (cytosine(1402)-N(4))-methyltransferase RsmH [Deltaproteobacteria bacterium]